MEKQKIMWYNVFARMNNIKELTFYAEYMARYGLFKNQSR